MYLLVKPLSSAAYNRCQANGCDGIIDQSIKNQSLVSFNNSQVNDFRWIIMNPCLFFFRRNIRNSLINLSPVKCAFHCCESSLNVLIIATYSLHISHLLLPPVGYVHHVFVSLRQDILKPNFVFTHLNKGLECRQRYFPPAQKNTALYFHPS